MFAIFSYLLLSVYLAGSLYMLGLMTYLVVSESKKSKKAVKPVVSTPKKLKIRKAM